MKIAIITEESNVKYIDRGERFHRKKSRKAIDVASSQELLTLLRNREINKIPSDDIQNEEFYKSILHEYIKSAEELYGGNFKEIYTLKKEIHSIRSIENSSLFIISGRYGLIGGGQRILPYTFHMNEQKKVKAIFERFQIQERISNIINEHDITLFFLPKLFIQILFNANNLNRIHINTSKKKYLIIISALSLKRNIEKEIEKIGLNLIFLGRPGVARIGKYNKTKILNVINKIIDDPFRQ
jgi:hypothetical protein